jgi:hypothetical protein
VKTALVAAGALVVGVVIGLLVGTTLRPPAPSPPADRPADDRERALPVVGGPAVEESAPSGLPEDPEPYADGPRTEMPGDGGATLAARLERAFRITLARGRSGDRQAEVAAEPVEALLARLAGEHGVTGGAPWILGDAGAGAVALRALLEGAGLALDAAQVARLEEVAEDVAPLFLAASDSGRDETERVALRRAAEVTLEAGIADLLHASQAGALSEALDGRSVAETLPGGEERDTLSSTGIDRAKAASVVLASYRKRIGLPGDPHPAVSAAIEAYVERVDGVNRALEVRWGRGFVEAVASGPTPHTDAAQRAREEPGYARRELEARARLWAEQARLEDEMRPYLGDAERARLGTARATALRLLLEGE